MTVQKRSRSNSVKDVINKMQGVTGVVPITVPKSEANRSPSLFSDLTSFRWMVLPQVSGKILAAILVSWKLWDVLPIAVENPLQPFVTLSYRLQSIPGENGAHYDKGPWDLAFLGFYIIVFSFIRQGLMEYIIINFARRLGITSESKLTRFMEQSYAVVYFSASGALGLVVMYKQKSWWYHPEHFWLEYPHWRMEATLKCYYLLQLSYWCQQMLVLVLRLEKPRSDFYELIIHHLVTLWLVGWSYLINLTIIGTAIFVSMDLPDVCLALSKCLNYLDLQRTSEFSFVFFLGVWHYMRHYLNIMILLSVWNDFSLIPVANRTWTESPVNPNGWWLFYGFRSGSIPAWMKYQIFAPILALQLVNTFWSFLIWRVLWRMVRGNPLKDVREEGEDSEGEDQPNKVTRVIEVKKEL